MTTVLRSRNRLQPLQDGALPGRLAVSAAARAGAVMTTEAFDSWFADRRAAGNFAVTRTPLTHLDGWRFAEGTGNLVHHSGRFFAVEGLRVRRARDLARDWQQPIINQAEIGILGILVKEFDGVLHCLMQAKMEPGNPNLVQLSPTVQATRSNYTRVHKGAPVRYLEHFLGPRAGKVIVDVSQSEHGAWFFHKSNRNMVVEVEDDIDLADDFCWLSLGQVYELLRRDNLVNMDSRTVLSCLPQPAPWCGPLHDPFSVSLTASRDAGAGAVHSTTELLSWFTDRRSSERVDTVRIPLLDVAGWHRHDDAVARDDGRYFSVVGVTASAGTREVARWSQPLFEPHGLGLAAFLVRRFGGVLHLLVSARVEYGFLDTIELGPTVQCTPEDYQDRSFERPAFLDYVLSADRSQIRYEAVHAEEGGRFLNAESRYLVLEADDAVPDEAPPGFAWATVAQLSELLRHGRYVNVQARTLVACLGALA